MSKIKMIGLDLDGTLLNTKKELTDYTKEVLARAIDQGVVVLTATGRPYTGIPEELREFPGMRYALTSNGARIMDREKLSDPESKGVVSEHLLPLKDAKKALEIFGKYDTLQEVYFDGQGYAEVEKMEVVHRYHHSVHMQEYVRKSRICVSRLDDIIEQENRPMDKVQGLFADMEERMQAWEELKQFKELELVGSLKYNIEINAAGVNKGKGLLELGKILGISRDEIMACGDGDNDIAMLQEVGFGVAMENADIEVKEAADYVTESNDEDGVAKAIARFVLGETV